MPQKYTHRYSDLLFEGEKCVSDSDFFNAFKKHREDRFDYKTFKKYPTFKVESFVYLRDNTVGWQRFIPDEMREKYMHEDDY